MVSTLNQIESLLLYFELESLEHIVIEEITNFNNNNSYNSSSS